MKKKVKIYPKEGQNVYINEDFDFDFKDNNEGYSIQAFEYVLFDDDENVVFKGTVDDYFVDEMYLDY